MNVTENPKCALCNVDLEETKYYYDDDWGHRGSKVWSFRREGTSRCTERILYVCPQCGLMYAQNCPMSQDSEDDW